MTEKQNIAPWVRIACVVLGLFAIVRAVEVLHPVINVLSMLPREGFDRTELFWALLGTIPAPSVLLAGGYCLIRYSCYLSTRIAHSADQQLPSWEYAAYRLAFTFAGILVISWALPRLGQVALNLTSRDNPMSEEMRRSAWNSLLWLVVQSAIGAYLVIGAPHIIKWQTRRSGEAIRQPQPDSPQQRSENDRNQGSRTT